MKRYLSTIIISLCLFSFPLTGQEVWPGDVNNNGIVNGVDLLYWGVAFGSSGPPRAEVSTDWQGVPLLSLWQQSFPDGLNYAYADCNGDGVVNEDDFDDAIEDNFGLVNAPVQPDGYANGQAGTAPRIRLQPDADVVGFGSTVNISLSLDDSAMPINDFYGLAFKLSYTSEVLEGDDGPDFELTENNWVEADNSYVQDFFEDNDDQGLADLAITRTNQQTIPVNPGEIGRFSIVIEDIIVGREIDTFRLRVDSIFLIDDEIRTIPVAPDTATIIVAKDPTTVTSTEQRQEAAEVKVFPNPVRREFYLEANTPIAEPRLVDNVGRIFSLEIQPVREKLYRVKLPQFLPHGVYWFSAKTPAGLIGEKIIFLNP